MTVPRSRSDLFSSLSQENRMPIPGLCRGWAFPYIIYIKVAAPGLFYGEKAGEIFILPQPCGKRRPLRASSQAAGLLATMPSSLAIRCTQHLAVAFGASSLYKTISLTGEGRGRPSSNIRQASGSATRGGRCLPPCLKAQHESAILFSVEKTKKTGPQAQCPRSFVLIRCASATRR